MASQRRPRLSKFLTTPTKPIPVDRDRSVAGLLEKMEGAGFGARHLAEAHRIWLDMLGDSTTIVLTISGAVVPAGMRRLLSYVIKNRFVDVLVLSGSVAFQDLHETLGRQHYQGHPSMPDAELEAASIGRLSDILASEEEYREAEEWIGGFTQQLESDRPYSTREYLNALGRELAEIATEDGLITSAFKARIPIFCPTIGTSGIAVGLATARYEKRFAFTFDLVQDVLELTQIMARSRTSGLINIGEGSARNFLHQTEVASTIFKTQSRGHKYAIQISPNAVQMAFNSSGTLDEEKLVFGRMIAGGLTAYVNCDPTIALPMIITALSQTAAKYMKGRKRPNFTFARELGVEIP